MFKKLFSFEGRIRRLEYGLSYLIYTLLSVFIGVLTDNILLNDRNDTSGMVLYIFYIPMLWFFFSQGAKRCHDLGNSGWFQIIPFYVFWLLFKNGQKGSNEYGVNPKGVEAELYEHAPLDYNADTSGK